MAQKAGREGGSRVVSRVQNEIKNTQVLLFAGGLGKRMGSERPKALVEVGGVPLVDRCIELFASCGYTNFVFLLGHGSKEVQNHVGAGDRYGIRASFSIDKDVGMGRASSLLQALTNGRVDASKRSVITFPDDIFTDESLPLRIVLEHLYGVETFHSTASLVLTRGRRWPYGVARVDESGLIRRFVEKPFIRKATSVGLYIFEPQVYRLIKRLGDRGEKWGIEQTLIPKLAKAGELYSVFVSSESWLPVNTQKDLEEAERALLDSRQVSGRQEVAASSSEQSAR